MDTLFLECVYININTKHTHTRGQSESPRTAGLRLAGLNSQEHLNILFSLRRNLFRPVKAEFPFIKIIFFKRSSLDFFIASKLLHVLTSDARVIAFLVSTNSPQRTTLILILPRVTTDDSALFFPVPGKSDTFPAKRAR